MYIILSELLHSDSLAGVWSWKLFHKICKRKVSLQYVFWHVSSYLRGWHISDHKQYIQIYSIGYSPLFSKAPHLQ